MLLMKFYITESQRQRLIKVYILLSSVCLFMSYLEFTLGLTSIEKFQAPLTALEKTDEELLPYTMILVGPSAMVVHFLSLSVAFSQSYSVKRTIGCTKMMTFLNFVKILMLLLEVAIIDKHYAATYPSLFERTHGFQRAMLKYGVDTSYMKAFDETQYSFKCCGNESVRDWLKIRWHKEYPSFKAGNVVPFSCCDHESKAPCQNDDALEELEAYHVTHDKSSMTIYRRGCYDVFYDRYVQFLVYTICIPGCIKVVLCFFLVLILRYLDTSIYTAVKGGFPTKSEFGYIFSCYEGDRKPVMLWKKVKKPLRLRSVSVGKEKSGESDSESPMITYSPEELQ